VLADEGPDLDDQTFHLAGTVRNVESHQPVELDLYPFLLPPSDILGRFGTKDSFRLRVGDQGFAEVLSLTRPRLSDLAVKSGAQLTLAFSAGVLAPAGTPAAIVEHLNATFNGALKSPELVASMAKLGFDPKTWSAQQYAAFLADEMKRWPPIVKASGVQPE